MISSAAVVSVRDFSDLSGADVAWAGGKGANLGELTRAELPVPPGFVVGAPAYAAFCESAGLRARLQAELDDVVVDDTTALDAAAARAQELVAETPMPAEVESAIRAAYASLPRRHGDPVVAVRSSATAEDTATASFAGMNATFLGVHGEDAVIDAVRRCWASLFGSRTVFYRAQRGFGHADMDIAVVVQLQIAASRAGVMFTMDPSTGNDRHLVIEASLGLGEAVVSGSVTPDRYVVDKETGALVAREIHRKELTIELDAEGGTVTRALTGDAALRPTLDEDDVARLVELGLRIETHYGCPQDTEWAFAADGTVWMLQSRPVTATGAAGRDGGPEEERGDVIVRGLGAAPGLASGPVRILDSPADGARLVDGDVLVAHMTTPDWVPLLLRAAAVVTDSGGMTCHAAIVSRELGIPCVVGTGGATTTLHDEQLVTVDAGAGEVREGREAATAAPPAPVVATAAPVTGTVLLVNLSEPSQVARAAALPVDGVGLLRAEMMVLEALAGDHPRLLVEEGRHDEFVDRMAGALTTFAAGFAPRPITYRTIDFRSNEFRGLRGGDRFEPVEANPMIGYRGALRYTREPDLLGLELDAIARVWDSGHHNLHVMLPFVRTESELRSCRAVLAQRGLLDRPGFELWIMAEVPSVLFSLERYAALGITGISIGSNDLTQLLLGADRDSELLAETFDERDPAVVAYLQQLIPRARDLGLRTSICGQAPSVHPEYAELLVRAGIDAVSVTPDAVDRTRHLLAAAEQRVLLEAARGQSLLSTRPPRGAPT